MHEPEYILFDTSFGYAGFAYQSDPFLIKLIFLPQPDKSSLKKQMGSSVRIVDYPHPPAEPAADVIRAYFVGKRITIPWPWLDMGQFSEAKAQVYRQVAGIPYGSTRSYGQIAADAGRAGAARFVGRCMADNPYPILIPCHRVVRSDGTLGGFGGGLTLKQRMLDLEAGH